MKKLFKSKIGLELAIPLIVVFGTVIFLTVFEKPGWLGFVILLLPVLFVVHIFMITIYTIENNKLTIKSGFLFNKTIDINTIKKITETNNPLSSPATSIDRLEITYAKFDSVIISSKQKMEFINNIKALNPNVEIKFKKKSKE